MLFNANTPLGLLRRKQLLQQQGLMADPGSGFQGVGIPGMSMPELMGTAAPQGPHFPAQDPANYGLMGGGAQQQPQPQQAPVQEMSTMASPGTVAGLADARKTAAGPTLDDKIMGLLNSPTFQLGMNLMGSSHSLNPWGDALNNTLGAQAQSAGMKQRQEQMALEAQKAQLEAELGRGNLDVSRGNLSLGQQRAQQEVPLMQAQTGLANAQAGAATGTMQLDQQKVAMQQQQMDRQNKFLDMASGLFGGGQAPQGAQQPPEQATPPQQQGGPTMQPGVFNPPQGGQAGKFGTPTQILDGLMQTESSGNPNAVNPTSGAMGAYQFMPQTVQMLAQQGMKFDPMDANQSRDAADFYLQSLNKKNGGDWQKTLADYGGFKTQDPSGYIQKVMDNGAQAQQGQQGAPAGPSGPVAAPGPIPVGGPGQGMKMAQAGALAGLAGVPGAAGMIDLGKMMQPQPVQAGGYQYDPNKGTYGFMPDPYKAAETALKTRQVGNETAKTAADLSNNETKRATAQANDTQDYRSAVAGMDRLAATTGQLLNHKGLAANTGWTGALGLAAKVPGSDAKDASVILDNLKSKLLVGTLSDLKKASQNGSSGFGQLSESEGDKLQAYVVNLDRAQSFDQMKAALKQIQDFAAQSKANYNDRYNALYGKGGAGVASSIGATPQENNTPAPTPAAPAAMSLDDYLKKRAPKRISNQEMTGTIRR